MGTAAQKAFGVTLAREGYNVAEITNLGDIEKIKKFIDVTNHSSVGGNQEQIPSAIKDSPKLTVRANYIIGDTNGQRAIQSDWENDTLSSYAIGFPNGLNYAGDAYVESYKVIGAMDKQIEIEIGLIFSGPLTPSYSGSAGLTTPYFAVNNDAVITPAPAAATLEYVAAVLTAIASVTVTPTATSGVITVNGIVVATGVPSSAIALGAAGSVNDITIIVAETNKAPKTYVIHVARAAA
jgi:predicted secreted protein